MLLEFCSGGALDDIMLGMILSFLHLIVLLSFFVRWGGEGDFLFLLYNFVCCHYPFLMDKRNL